MNDPIRIGSRRELFVDDYLIERMDDDLSLRLHSPEPRDIALATDKPWEGSMSTYITVFRDDGMYRMYYTGWELVLEKAIGKREEVVNTEPHPMWVCMAESRDGMQWQRQEVGLIEHDGSTANNIVWQGVGENQHGIHGFAPFKDPNPDAASEARYKAVGGDRRATKGDLYAMKSPDGIHWSLLQEGPILRQRVDGKFDSQNLAFWDAGRGEYRLYCRAFRQGSDGKNYRDIKTATSKDFINWSQTEWLDYPGAPDEELYTNQVMPYPRASHIFVGFPSRYVCRPWSPAIEALPEREHRELRSSVNERFGTALSDGLFMSSRDGRTFKRWGEAFIRPGPQLENQWAYGDNYQCWGTIETPSALDGAPPELSFFAREGVWRGNRMAIRRYSLRMDGFVSVRASLAGGTLVTHPLTFSGNTLEMNFATSAAGSIRVELQDADGSAIPGFALDDCVEQIGDELDRTVAWRGGRDLSRCAGQPVRLRFVMKDADLFAMRFKR